MLTVTVTVPRLLTSKALPPTAFTAVQDGHTVPLTATRVVDFPSELVVVLDASVALADFDAEQSAVADLLRSVPSQLPTTVLPGGEPTTARSALEKLGDLRPQPGGLLDGLPDAPTVRRLVVVVASCRTLDSETRTFGGSDTQVSVLGTDAGCGVAANRLGGPEPGVVRVGLDGVGLLGAADDVSRALLGQYVVRTAPGVGTSPLAVTVRADSIVATGTVPVPAPPTVATPVAVGGQRRGPLLVAGALAVLAALALALEVARRLSTRPA